MHEKIPQSSGQDVLRLLGDLGYGEVRQRGSHVRLLKRSSGGEHHVTIPLHHTIAKGTLNDILNSVSCWNGIPRDELIFRLKNR